MKINKKECRELRDNCKCLGTCFGCKLMNKCLDVLFILSDKDIVLHEPYSWDDASILTVVKTCNNEIE